jgi:cellobiose-specific phosphotransferase system component IIB
MPFFQTVANFFASPPPPPVLLEMDEMFRKVQKTPFSTTFVLKEDICKFPTKIVKVREVELYPSRKRNEVIEKSDVNVLGFQVASMQKTREVTVEGKTIKKYYVEETPEMKEFLDTLVPHFKEKKVDLSKRLYTHLKREEEDQTFHVSPFIHEMRDSFVVGWRIKRKK